MQDNGEGAVAMAAAPRLVLLDILRGVAILGILFMNISDMGGSLYAFLGGDVRRLGWSGADQVAWWLREVIANGTARCLLEMLFGAGMVILTERITLRAYAWRNVVLVAFGLIHVFVLLWPGDILHTYGLAALVAMGARRLRPRLLLTIGLSLATVQLVHIGSHVLMASSERQAVAKLRTEAVPPGPERQRIATFDEHEGDRAKDRTAMTARADAEDRARTGTTWSWATSLWGFFLFMQVRFLEVVFVLEAAATMLVGAALYRWGVLQGARSRAFYGRLTIAGYGFGLPLRAWDAWVLTRFDHLPSLAAAFQEYARLATTLGHVGSIALLATSAAGARLVQPFAAAGRTALTLYVLQTIVTLWVLYPPLGLALYGRQGWVALMLTALAIDAALLVLANWWVSRFAIAPVEWAWRSMVAGRRLAWRRYGRETKLASPGHPRASDH